MRAVLLAALMVVTTNAKANNDDGNKLVEHCRLDSLYVRGFIAGIVDKATDDIAIASERLAGDQRMHKMLFEIEPYCIPANATVGQSVDVFCKYLKDNPGERHLPASRLVGKALGAVWKCKQ